MYLIDTDILIYSLKNDANVKKKFIEHSSHPKAISVVSYGELYFGAFKSAFPEKNLAVVRRISELFPVLEVSRSIMETFGELKAKLQKKGNVLSDLDLIIASTALSMNFVLVTNNVRHFKRISGLTYENWKE